MFSKHFHNFYMIKNTISKINKSFFTKKSKNLVKKVNVDSFLKQIGRFVLANFLRKIKFIQDYHPVIFSTFCGKMLI
jgi:hypothetical protein